MKKILVIQGHPNKASFCQVVAERYADSAKKGGHSVEVVSLGALAFDPILRYGFQKEQALEVDLLTMQQKISDANHIVWVYPNWWGGQPALLKGFIDRTFLPGFAFKYKSGLSMPEKLLAGRTTEIILTLDTPVWLYRYFMRAPGLKAMKNGVLEFCGLKVIRSHLMGPIRGSTPEAREQWLRQVGDLI